MLVFLETLRFFNSLITIEKSAMEAEVIGLGNLISDTDCNYPRDPTEAAANDIQALTTIACE